MTTDDDRKTIQDGKQELHEDNANNVPCPYDRFATDDRATNATNSGLTDITTPNARTQ